MEKRTGIMLVLFVVLLAGVISAKMLIRPAGERHGDRPRPLAAVKAADIDGLEVTQNKLTTVLKKTGDTWALTAPMAYPADASSVKTALEKIESLAFEGTVTDRADKHAEFEVSDEKAVHVVARKGASALADIYIGKVAGGVTLLRVAGKNDVWRAVGALKYVFGKEPKNWRDHEVLTFKREEVEKIELDTASGKVVCKREGGEGGKPDRWTIAEAPASTKIDKLDDTVPAGILSTMTSLRAYDFADGVQPQESGLGTPAATTIAYLKGGSTRKVMVGKQKGDQFYVRVPERDQVFLISKYSVERLTKKPIDFRDKTIVDLKPDQIVGVTIDMEGGQKTELMRGVGAGAADWKAVAPKDLTVDDTKVRSLLSAFTGLKAHGFADEATTKIGLQKTSATVTAKLKDKGAVTLKFGTLKEQDYPVQKIGSPDVFIIKKYAAERLLKKPDDLKKTAGVAAPPRRPGQPIPPLNIPPQAAPAPVRTPAPAPTKAR